VSKVEEKASITIRFYSLLSVKMGIKSFTLETDNMGELLDYLEGRFGSQFREQFHRFRVNKWNAEGKVVTEYINGRIEDFCILLLNGRKVDYRNLRQAKLKEGDTLHILPPSTGG